MVGNMGFARAVMVVCIMMTAVRITSATQYTVGDSEGWRIMGTVNYTKWAASKKIYTGDTLLFEYNKKWHNVLEVTKSDYDSCKNGSPIATYEGGHNIVKLPKTGFFYYLCGITGHCEVGQKVAINVLTANTSSPSPSPSPATSPSPADSKESKPKSAASSPSPSPKVAHNKTSPAPSASKTASESKNSAHAKSAGSALALMWALGSLSFFL